MRRYTWIWLVVGITWLGMGGCPVPPGLDLTGGEALTPAAGADSTAHGTAPVAPVDTEVEQGATEAGGGSSRPAILPNPDTGQTTGGPGSGSAGGAGSAITGEPEEPQAESSAPAVPVGTTVDKVAAQLLAACRALAAPSALADARLVLNANTTGEFGYCPTVRYASSEEVSLVAVDFEYTGCSSAATAGLAFAGNLGLYIYRDTGAAAMEYCSFSINHRTVTGRIEAHVVALPAGVSILGTCRIATAGVGKVQGDLDLQCHELGWYSFSANQLAVTSGDWTADVALSSLLVDPFGNQSFVPASGFVTFTVANPTPPPVAVHVNVQFTARSPVDGTVLVSVNGGTPFEHKIPIEVP